MVGEMSLSYLGDGFISLHCDSQVVWARKSVPRPQNSLSGLTFGLRSKSILSAFLTWEITSISSGYSWRAVLTSAQQIQEVVGAKNAEI